MAYHADKKTAAKPDAKDKFSSREAAWRTAPEARANATGKNLDPHELMKRQMFGSANDASDNHFEKSRPSPDAVYGVSDQYICFDTFEQAVTSKPAQGRFDWNMMVQGTTGDQVIGVKDVANTVIEIQIAPFVVPPPAPNAYTLNAASADYPTMGTNTALPILVANGAAPSAAALTSALTQLPYGGRVTLEMAKITSQGISDTKGARHHYELQAENHLVQTSAGAVETGLLSLKPLLNWDTWVFVDPIQSVHGMSMVFRNGDTPVAFPTSVMTGIQASVAAAAQLLTFTTGAAHGLAAGDRIYIKGFATGNQIIDNYIKGDAGLLVGVAGLTSTAFRLNPDVSTALLGLAFGAPVPSATSTTLLIAKNRIRVPMRLRGVVQRLTNYIAP